MIKTNIFQWGQLRSKLNSQPNDLYFLLSVKPVNCLNFSENRTSYLYFASPVNVT